MSRAAIAIIGLVAAVVLAFFAAPFVFTRSSAYDQFVCTHCGIRRAENIRTFAGFVYHRGVTLESSAVSRAIKVQNCQHSWFLYRFGHTSKGRFLRPGAFIDGGSRSSALPFLLGDEVFARELSQVENPSGSWAALVSALDSSRAFDEAFLLWWHESDHVGFAAWAATNGLSGKVKAK